MELCPHSLVMFLLSPGYIDVRLLQFTFFFASHFPVGAPAVPVNPC